MALAAIGGKVKKPLSIVRRLKEFLVESPLFKITGDQVELA
jgi:hypothetical protein